MTAEKDPIAEVVLRTLRSRVEEDPRIEAVAKLLFTGPLEQMHPDQWERAKAERWGPAVSCLMAAEDVLRGIDDADGEGPMTWICPECGQPTKTASEHEERHLAEGTEYYRKGAVTPEARTGCPARWTLGSDAATTDAEDSWDITPGSIWITPLPMTIWFDDSTPIFNALYAARYPIHTSP